MANAFPHLTTAVEEPTRNPQRRAVEAAYAEAVRLANGGAYDKMYPQRRLAVDMLLKTECASIDKDGNLVRSSSAPELVRRLDFWRDVEIVKCILGTTKNTAPTVAPVRKSVVPDEDHSPLDEMPPWDGVGEDILAATEMDDDAVDTDEEGDEIDD